MALPTIPVVCLESQAEVWQHARESFEDQSRYLLIRSPAILSEVVSLSDRIGPAVLLTESSFLYRLPPPGIRTLWTSGKLEVLVIAGVKDESESVESYLREGCAGVVMVCNTPDVYRKAVQSAVSGELWAPRKVVAKVLRDMIRLGSESARQLTDRESEILSLIGMGYNNRDIATHLFISKETVRWHVRSLYAKLGFSDRDSAIRYWSLARPK